MRHQNRQINRPGVPVGGLIFFPYSKEPKVRARKHYSSIKGNPGAILIDPYLHLPSEFRPQLNNKKADHYSAV